MPATANRTQVQQSQEVRGTSYVPVPAQDILPPDVLADMQNAVMSGAAGSSIGYAKSRPGLRAALASVASGPIVLIQRFRKPSGTHSALIAVGTAFTGNDCKLWVWDFAATTITKISDMLFYIVPNADEGLPGVDFEPMGAYIFVIGAQDGKPYRMPLTGTTLEPAYGLDNPTAAPTVTVANKPLSDFAAADWNADHLSASANDILNGTFTGTPTSPTNWTFSSGTTCDTRFGLQMLRLDDPSYNALSALRLNNLIANTNDTTTPAGSAIRYATKFLFQGTYNTDSGGIQDGITATVIVYDNSNVEIARLSHEFDPGLTDQLVALKYVFSFPNLDPTTPVKYALYLSPGTNVRAAGPTGPYVTGVSLKPFIEVTTFSDISGGYIQPSFSLQTFLTDTTQNDQVFWGDQHFSADLGTGSPYDLSMATRLDLPFLPQNDLTAATVRFRFGLKIGANLTAARAAAPILTDPGSVLVSTNNGTHYLSVDLTTLDSATRATLTDVYVIEIIWQQDATVAVSGSNTGRPLGAFGQYANSGALAAGFSYQAIFEEVTDGNDDVNRIESGFSPVSVSVTTDGLNATLKIVLPAGAPYNADTDGYQFGIIGGDDLSGLFYLVARVPLATAQTWTGFTWDGATGLYTSDDGYTTWNPTTKTLVTDVPDAVREQLPILFDHNPPPLNATAFTVYQNRLVYFANSFAYISRFATGVSVGIYFNDSPDPASADYVNAGNKLPVGVFQDVAVGGAIINAAGLDNACAILLAEELWELRGVDNRSFKTNRYSGAVNAGLIARNAMTIVNGRLWWLGATSIYAFDGNTVTRDLGLPVMLLLNPQSEFGGAALNTAAFARSSMVFHAGRLYLSAPTSTSGAAIAQTLVYDTRINQWQGRWFIGPILAGASFSGSGENGDLIVTDNLGMLSSIGNNQYGDTATSGGSITAVTLRLFPRTVTDNGMFKNTVRATRGNFVANCAGAMSVQLDFWNDSNIHFTPPALAMTGQTGDTTYPRPIKIASCVNGLGLNMSAAFTSTTDPVTVKRIQMEYTQGQLD